VALVSLQTMRETALARAGMENSGFITTAEANAVINAEAGELFDLLISRPTNPFTTKLEFTIASGSEYTLASTFLNLRGLDFQYGAEWIELHRASFRQRNRTAIGARTRANDRMFDLIGPTLYITPSQAAIGTYRLWYDPQFVPLALDADTLDLPNQWHEFITCGAAAKYLTKEESDASVWLALKEKAEARILAATTERDRGAPRRIVDVTGCEEDEYP